MSPIRQTVSGIIEEVRRDGDQALVAIATRLSDKPFRELSADEVTQVCSRLPNDRKRVLDFAAANIRKFAQAAKSAVADVSVDYGEYTAGMRFVPVSRVACYVPGGRYPLPSTALMTTIPASVAGVAEIYILSPALTDEVIYAGTVGGATRFFQVGGAQAVAAAAFGTRTIPRADMIVGPGNAFVTEAKRQLLGTIGIDMLAGPSEVAIIADDGANPAWLALDMLSQAEHDPDARCTLVTNSDLLAEAVRKAIDARIKDSRDRLPDFITEESEQTKIIVVDSLEECAARVNEIAPEHLALNLRDADSVRPLLTNYGALFIGANATVPYGDYVAGPNHTLPTGGTARFSSGLSPLTFLRTQTWIDVPKPSPSLIANTREFATIEGLLAHADAAAAR
jgi:histidinol dehydrogenase